MLKDLLKSNRSYRSYDFSHKIDTTTLLDIVDHVRFAPSSANMQPLKYIVVNNEDLVIGMEAQIKLAMLLTDIQLPPPNGGPSAYIVVCQDSNISKNSAPFHIDVGIVSHTILLAAAEKNYGGCMIGNFNKTEVSKLLSLNNTLQPCLVIALGKVNETVQLDDLVDGDSTHYYRQDGIHHVPKRQLKDIVTVMD